MLCNTTSIFRDQIWFVMFSALLLDHMSVLIFLWFWLFGRYFIYQRYWLHVKLSRVPLKWLLIWARKWFWCTWYFSFLVTLTLSLYLYNCNRTLSGLISNETRRWIVLKWGFRAITREAFVVFLTLCIIVFIRIYYFIHF